MACARHNLEYVTLMKEGKRAGLPKRVRSPRVCAQGVGGGHNTRIETAVFFLKGFLFERKFVNSRWFFCALCAMQLRACVMYQILCPKFAESKWCWFPKECEFFLVLESGGKKK